MLRYASTNRELSRVLHRYFKRGERVILDYARENCTPKQAPEVEYVTKKIIESAPPGSMCALKMSSFAAKGDTVGAKARVDSVIRAAVQRDLDVAIDAEEVLYPETSYDFMHEYNTKEKARVYKTYQMYRRDAFEELLGDIESSHQHGFMLGAKLVRGAYLNTQPNVFDNKFDVDHNYNKALHYTCTAPHVHTMVATHNPVSLRIVRKFDRNRYVTAKLMGFDEKTVVDYRYVPYGTLRELTPYLFRRLRERLSWSTGDTLREG